MCVGGVRNSKHSGAPWSRRALWLPGFLLVSDAMWPSQAEDVQIWVQIPVLWSTDCETWHQLPLSPSVSLGGKMGETNMLQSPNEQ